LISFSHFLPPKLTRYYILTTCPVNLGVIINGSSDDNIYRAEIERLQKIIGKQAIQIEILKKTEEFFGRR